MKLLLVVFLGGGLGSVLRYIITSQMNSYYYSGTITVNLIGSFIIGILAALLYKNVLTQDLFLLFSVGFCGGFTTFSTYSLENVMLLKSEKYFQLLFQIIIIPILGLISAFLGWKIIEK